MERSIKTLSGPSWPGLRYFSTLRQGGYSQGGWQGLNLGEHCGDQPQHVAQNRELLYGHLPSVPHWLQQVHGTGVYQARRPLEQAHHWDQAPIADAAWTTCPKTVIAVLTADCLPVVITNDQATIVGVAHAGWRGLVNGVVENLFYQMQTQAPATSHWRAWIGPAISQTYFEVGAEVFDAFKSKNTQFERFFITANIKGKYQADLAGIAAAKLRLIAKNRITIDLSHACTYGEQAKYYSFRRQPSTGRIATLAWLE
ncbi:MAG: peptidoglycan editing factor PgeF [Alcaligenaceae bacterium]|nr:peptidoglycan editing factor PgeF [Alcaligenaceae bacterium]